MPRRRGKKASAGGTPPPSQPPQSRQPGAPLQGAWTRPLLLSSQSGQPGGPPPGAGTSSPSQLTQTGPRGAPASRAGTSSSSLTQPRPRGGLPPQATGIASRQSPEKQKKKAEDAFPGPSWGGRPFRPLTEEELQERKKQKEEQQAKQQAELITKLLSNPTDKKIYAQEACPICEGNHSITETYLTRKIAEDLNTAIKGYLSKTGLSTNPTMDNFMIGVALSFEGVLRIDGLRHILVALSNDSLSSFAVLKGNLFKKLQKKIIGKVKDMSSLLNRLGARGTVAIEFVEGVNTFSNATPPPIEAFVNALMKNINTEEIENRREQLKGVITNAKKALSKRTTLPKERTTSSKKSTKSSKERTTLSCAASKLALRICELNAMAALRGTNLQWHMTEYEFYSEGYLEKNRNEAAGPRPSCVGCQVSLPAFLCMQGNQPTAVRGNTSTAPISPTILCNSCRKTQSECMCGEEGEEPEGA